MSRWCSILVLLVAACGKGDSQETSGQTGANPPAIDAHRGPTGDDLAKVARQQVDVLEQLADAADATKGDCKAMAAKIDAIVTSSRDFYDRLAKLIEDDDTAKKLDTLGDAMRDRSEAAMRKLEPALTPCMADSKLSTLMDSILL